MNSIVKFVLNALICLRNILELNKFDIYNNVAIFI